MDPPLSDLCPLASSTKEDQWLRFSLGSDHFWVIKRDNVFNPCRTDYSMGVKTSRAGWIHHVQSGMTVCAGASHTSRPNDQKDRIRSLFCREDIGLIHAGLVPKGHMNPANTLAGDP